MPRGERGPTDTGIPVYPRLPVPSQKRDSEPSFKKPSQLDKKLIAAVAATLVGGLVLGFVLRPVLTTDPRIGEAEAKVGEANAAADSQKKRADDLDKTLVTTKTEKAAAESKLTEAMKAQKELATRVAEAENKAKAVSSAKEKLQKVVNAQVGIVSADGEEITLRLVDRVMFKPLDDQLTDRGKAALDKVAVALKELSDRQIWVQGHTDDSPIRQPPVVQPRPPPLKKGQKPGPPPAAPGPKFATNWELSAARALTVVHYLQDVSKIDPSRLAALAFGQYRPISRNRALNRRIEIVLYPKPVVKKK